MRASSLFLGSCLVVLGGCASTSPKEAFRDVAATVREHSGRRVFWDQNTSESPELARAIDTILAHELGPDAAVQVALLASPRLRGTFEELSLAQADLVDAGLLSNPSLTVGRTGWEMEHLTPNLFASIEMSFLDALTLPLKRRVATAQLEATKLEVADEVLRLASEVRAAYYGAVAARQIADVRRLVREAADTSLELAKRQHEAGNTSELALEAEHALASKARLDLAKSEGDAVVLREQLTKLLGLDGKRTSYRLEPRLPELPESEIDPAGLETAALARRLDIGALKHEIEATSRAITLAKTTRWTGAVDVHVEAGRLKNSHRFSFGPSVSIEIPLFNQRQASIARLESHERKMRDTLVAVILEAKSDVRAAAARVANTRTAAIECTSDLVPAREAIVRLSQQQYDAMLIGVYRLLDAKQAEFDAYREAIESLRDYWIARSDLERTTGSRLPAAERKT